MEKSKRYADITVGDELEPVTVEVTREMIRNYGELLDDCNPYYADSSDFGGPIVHPSLAAILIFRLYNVRSPAPAGGIHAKQEFDFHHPIRPGTRTRISGRITDKYEKRGRKYIVTETWIEDEKGELLVTGRGYGIVPE